MRVPGNDTKGIAAARQSSVISRYAYITMHWIVNTVGDVVSGVWKETTTGSMRGGRSTHSYRTWMRS